MAILTTKTTAGESAEPVTNNINMATTVLPIRVRDTDGINKELERDGDPENTPNSDPATESISAPSEQSPNLLHTTKAESEPDKESEIHADPSHDDNPENKPNPDSTAESVSPPLSWQPDAWLVEAYTEFEPTSDCEPPTESELRASLARLGCRPSHPPSLDIFTACSSPKYGAICRAWCRLCDITAEGQSSKALAEQVSVFCHLVQQQHAQRQAYTAPRYLRRVEDILRQFGVAVVDGEFAPYRREQDEYHCWLEFLVQVIHIGGEEEEKLKGLVKKRDRAWRKLVDAGCIKSDESYEDACKLNFLSTSAKEVWDKFLEYRKLVQASETQLNLYTNLRDWIHEQVKEMAPPTESEEVLVTVECPEEPAGLPFLPEQGEMFLKAPKPAYTQKARRKSVNAAARAVYELKARQQGLVGDEAKSAVDSWLRWDRIFDRATGIRSSCSCVWPSFVRGAITMCGLVMVCLFC